jgi:hypothetical protein
MAKAAGRGRHNLLQEITVAGKVLQAKRNDAADAARYRFLRKWTVQNIDDFPITEAPTSPEHYDRLVDAAIAGSSRTSFAVTEPKDG